MENGDYVTRLDEYREKSLLADRLVGSGKTEEALSLLREWRDKASAVGDEDYRLYFEAELLEYTNSDYPAQIAFLDQALAYPRHDPHQTDFFILRDKGVYLSKMGDMKGAIKLFDQALAINPDDYNSLRQKGVSLSKLDDEMGAIECFDKALAIKPNDYNSLNQKGVSLAITGDRNAALDCYKMALDINPDSYNTIRNWAFTANVMGNHDVAQNKISQAVQICPKALKDDFFTIMRLSGKNPEEEWRVLFPDAAQLPAEPVDRLRDIRDFVGTIREQLGDKGQEFLRQKELAENTEKMFLHPESLMAPDRSFFLVLRKWNSYTPAIPTDEDERSRGGGYFIYHQGKGTVIDPGYNFIENFHQAGCRIHDIDTIVITHAHNDHTIDFESICTLFHQYNRAADKAGYPKKQISLYFNNGAFKKFSGLLNLMDRNFDVIHTLNVGNVYQIYETMHLTVLPAFHDEVISRDQSVGLFFTLICGENKRKIVFTSDTGLFPLSTASDDLEPDIKLNELWEEYPQSALEKPDLLVVHIGSIKKEELEVDLNLGIEKCLYPNHLGMIGTARMITKLKPKLALVSEFGEEMRDFRRTIVERIEADVVHKVVTTEPKPRVAPADLACMYDIAQGKFLCCTDDSWNDVTEIAFNYGDNNKEDIYYFCKENLDNIDVSVYAHKVKEFKARRKERKGMYFR